jgi:hypothetical protein
MGQISDVEEKPLTSSLNICPEACCGKGWWRSGVTPTPLFYSVDISFKDDVTVVLLIDVSFII